MAVDGGFPWEAASTQIQMVCNDIVVDRYDLSAVDIATIQRELTGEGNCSSAVQRFAGPTSCHSLPRIVMPTAMQTSLLLQMRAWSDLPGTTVTLSSFRCVMPHLQLGLLSIGGQPAFRAPCAAQSSALLAVAVQLLCSTCIGSMRSCCQQGFDSAMPDCIHELDSETVQQLTRMNAAPWS